ncbi:MAG: SusD/RagB family nutrient-binding outer membrane lipoprotein [Chitinophagaceae bacterium]|nr:MAG: SusD/RagB family nutrient-binding outer membrane lipoprotein [Chitinophagaceae bacterium]
MKHIMKYKRGYIAEVALGLMSLMIFLVSGCTKNFTSLNTPTNLVTESKITNATLGAAFADAEFYGLIGSVGAGWELMHELHASIYSQIFTTTSSGFTTDQFQEVPSWVDAGWQSFYSGPATMVKFVEDYTAGHNMPVENAIAKIYSIPMYERMTDFFGPIPFSQFGNGQTSVSYDSQQSVYESFFKILDSAVAVLQQNTSATPFGTNDIIYGGNVQNWITLANSLRLRLAMRIVYADPTLAQQEAEKAVAAGVMTSNNQNALILTTPNNLNYLTRWTYIDPFCMSATQYSILVGFNDPRLTAFWAQGGGRLGGTMGFNGVRNGLPVALKTSALRNGSSGCSFVSKQFLPIADGGSNPKCIVMDAAEVYLLRAEGALRGWNMGGTAQDFYNAGITHSLQYWTNASAQDIQNYINSTATPVPVPNNGVVNQEFNTPAESNITVQYEANAPFETQLEQIITQKWLDFFLQPWEAWAERRRTGYPRGYAIIASLNPSIPVTAIIRRMVYPPSEYSNNNAAVTKAVSTYLGGDNNTMTRVWWDQKPLSEYPDLSNTIVH